jgi:hypothetical protein
VDEVTDPSKLVYLSIAPGAIVALVGGRVSHQTPPAARDDLAVIASLCSTGDGAAL